MHFSHIIVLLSAIHRCPGRERQTDGWFHNCYAFSVGIRLLIHSVL